MIWGYILKSLQNELNKSAMEKGEERKLLKIIIVPMSPKMEENEELGKMCVEWQMPIIPFEDTYAIQHIIHRFNPDLCMPVLTLVEKSGIVMDYDAMAFIEKA